MTAMRKKIKAVVLPPLKRRSKHALDAKMRHAGPMADTRWHTLCSYCQDSGTVTNGKNIEACPECQGSHED